MIEFSNSQSRMIYNSTSGWSMISCDELSAPNNFSGGEVYVHTRGFWFIH